MFLVSPCYNSKLQWILLCCWYLGKKCPQSSLISYLMKWNSNDGIPSLKKVCAKSLSAIRRPGKKRKIKQLCFVWSSNSDRAKEKSDKDAPYKSIVSVRKILFILNYELHIPGRNQVLFHINNALTHFWSLYHWKSKPFDWRIIPRLISQFVLALFFMKKYLKKIKKIWTSSF